MSRSFYQWGWLPLCIGACSETPEPPPTPADPWSDQEEVLHQTREVIRFVDEWRRLEMEQLRELGIDLPPPEQQGEPQDPQH